MKRNLLLGFAVMALLNCNRTQPVEPPAEDEQAVSQGGGMRGPGRMCEGDKAEARIAKMQKCQSEAAAACNTQIYGSATPTKDVICADHEKMKQVWKCVKEKYGDDREKMKADRKRQHECVGNE